MSLFERVLRYEKWNPDSHCIGKRICIAWHEVFKSGHLEGVDVVAATTGEGVAFWIEPDSFSDFIDVHRNSIWVIAQSHEGLCWLEEKLQMSFKERIQQRLILDTVVLYELFHLVEYGDVPADGSLDYLTEVYLEERITANEGAFMPEIFNLPELKANGKIAKSIYSAAEMAISISGIFPMLWKEVLGLSSEKVLLGYDKRSLGVYSAEKLNLLRPT